MAIHYRTQGFILKKQDLGEADRIFTIFTKDFGKLEILGRAIRKIKSKLRGGVREFSLSEIEFIQGRTFKTLTDASQIESFRNFRNDLKKLNIVYQISEVLTNFLKGQEPDPKIWNLLNKTFQKLNTSYKLPRRKASTPRGRQVASYKIYYYFLWNLFSILGYQPQLYNCPVCQKKITREKLYWNSKEGGVICSSCSKKIGEAKTTTLPPHSSLIDLDTIKILRLFLKRDWPTLNKLKLENRHLKSLKNISNNYLAYFLEK